MSRSDVLILGYHGVSERWSSSLAVRPSQFERQLQLLRSRGYQGVTVACALTDPPPGRCVAITFDDGYRSVIEHALPIMRQFGMPGTVFVPTDFIGSERAMCWDGIEEWHGTADEGELIPMSWDELGRLSDAGWEVGSHTCTHPHLTRIDRDLMVEELAQSRARCQEQLGRACRTIAYPYGDIDRGVVEATKHAGYCAGAAIVPVPLRPFTSFNWPRTGVYRQDDDRRFALKIGPPGRRLHASHAWLRVSRARAALLRRSPAAGVAVDVVERAGVLSV